MKSHLQAKCHPFGVFWADLPKSQFRLTRAQSRRHRWKSIWQQPNWSKTTFGYLLIEGLIPFNPRARIQGAAGIITTARKTRLRGRMYRSQTKLSHGIWQGRSPSDSMPLTREVSAASGWRLTQTMKIP